MEDEWQAGELRSSPDASGAASVVLEDGGRVMTIDTLMVAPSNPKLQVWHAQKAGEEWGGGHCWRGTSL